MGAYLNKPITEKETVSEFNGKVRYAATSMQGWRVNQEDAHNCILDFADGWHMFAVYDGHGGPEVSKYVAANFPQFLVDRKVWEAEDIEKALQESFIEFDDVLRSSSVMKELKVLAKGAEGGSDKESEDGESDGIMKLVEEGTIPLQELLKRFGYTMVGNGAAATAANKNVIAVKDIEDQHIAEAEAATISSREDDGDESTSSDHKKRPSESPGLQQRAKRAKSENGTDEEREANGDSAAPPHEEEESGDTAEKKKEEATTEPEVVVKKAKAIPTHPKKAEKAEVNEGEDDESDDDDFNEDEEDDDEEEDEDEEEEEEDEEAEEDMEEYEEDGYGGLSGASFGPSGETPGEDSGTTACMCLVAPGKVIVANAGDSRAVLCRGGKAVDLSLDHKPEDECEKKRIESAGGHVNEDGRVNGGLNLSRALGDHCYKKNKVISLRDQMISALPDVRVEMTQDDDEFIVVACDGIWNSMESQEVIDFVRERIDTHGMAISQICEELCTACLAPSTEGDGTGCDNMTVVIAHLKPRQEEPPHIKSEDKKENVSV